MADAKRDENNTPTLLAGLESDGVTPVKVTADPSDHSLGVDNNTTGNDHGPGIDIRDGNFVPALIAVSSVDGVTPVVVYATADGLLLIDSN